MTAPGARLARVNAREMGFDPGRIGVMGFSAGGELAARAAMSDLDGDPAVSDPIDRRSSRPNFQVLIYPGNAGALTVSKASPPVFIAAGYNDRPDISKGMAELYLKYKDAGVPAELHLYAGAGHGFGFRATNRSARGMAGSARRVDDGHEAALAEVNADGTLAVGRIDVGREPLNAPRPGSSTHPRGSPAP